MGIMTTPEEIVKKQLLAGVIDGNTKSKWYETKYPFKFNLDGRDVFLEMGKIKPFYALPADTYSDARFKTQQAAGNGVLKGVLQDYTMDEINFGNPLFLHTVLPGDTQNTLVPLRLTNIPDSNGSTFIAKKKYDDLGSETLDNWIMPPHIPMLNGDPSLQFQVRLFKGHPASPLSQEITLATGETQDGRVSWYFNYATGMLFCDTEATSNGSNPVPGVQGDLFNLNDLWIIGYRYIGKTAQDGGGGLQTYRLRLKYDEINVIDKNGIYEIDSQDIPAGKGVAVYFEGADTKHVQFVDFSKRFGLFNLDVYTQEDPAIVTNKWVWKIDFQFDPFTYVKGTDPTTATWLYQTGTVATIPSELVEGNAPPDQMITQVLQDGVLYNSAAPLIDILEHMFKGFGFQKTPLPVTPVYGTDFYKHFEVYKAMNPGSLTVISRLFGDYRSGGEEYLSLQPEYRHFDLLPFDGKSRTLTVPYTNDKVKMAITPTQVGNADRNIFVIQDPGFMYEFKNVNSVWDWYRYDNYRGIV